ncbi:MAG: tungsten ABC transporter substrate-binding protein [Gemmatimonadetes bacterium]|nr:MAG: tungsten ABC transporter substrate-binding protein [Gemmatimonadota bacterium]
MARRRLEDDGRLRSVPRADDPGEKRPRGGTDAGALVRRRHGAAALTAAAVLVAVPCRPLSPLAAQSSAVILATTTSTRDAGLLDSILPDFERASGYTVRVIAVGSGQALAMGKRGDADVVLSHAPEAERVLVDSGYYVRRRIVMHNEFLIVGPAADPAGLRGMSDPVAAMRRISEGHGPFVSRGDQSGTHLREQLLWKRAGFSTPPRNGWRATYLAWRDKLHVVPMVEGDTSLYNVYHVLELNPKNASRINVAGGRALADFLVAPETQRRIGEFGKGRFSQSLFVPDAGKEPSP